MVLMHGASSSGKSVENSDAKQLLVQEDQMDEKDGDATGGTDDMDPESDMDESAEVELDDSVFVVGINIWTFDVKMEWNHNSSSCFH